MRKLLIILIAVIVLQFAIRQLIAWRRFEQLPYRKSPSTQVDSQFYNPGELRRYYALIEEQNSFVRGLYFYDGIDVLHPDPDEKEEISYAKQYQERQAEIQYLENRLLLSRKYRDAGYTSTEIKQMLEMGISPSGYLLSKILRSTAPGFVLKQGEKNSSVVWEVQKILTEKGYMIPIDGVFGIETYEAIRDFQKKNRLFPSGVIDEFLLYNLFQQP
ncbi:MAG: peptidoglycan-binding protein [Bacteroidia bacterium]|nr:peptidoglycan-binding protein [Bacteroidia bacterium]